MNTENNILIAEFLNYSFEDGNFKVPHSDKTSNSDFKEWCPTYWDETLDSGGYLVAPCNLMFSYDWNWLHVVIEKINNLSTNNQEILHWSRNNWTIFDLLLYVSDINTVYNEVVSFIKWYNENSAEKN